MTNSTEKKNVKELENIQKLARCNRSYVYYTGKINQFSKVFNSNINWLQNKDFHLASNEIYGRLTHVWVKYLVSTVLQPDILSSMVENQPVVAFTDFNLTGLSLQLLRWKIVNRKTWIYTAFLF